MSDLGQVAVVLLRSGKNQQTFTSKLRCRNVTLADKYPVSDMKARATDFCASTKVPVT